MNTTSRSGVDRLEGGTSPVVEVLRNVLKERFDIAAGDLGPERRLDSLGLDSLGFVEYVFEVEKALRITLPDVPREIETVGPLVALIESEVRKQRGDGAGS